MPIPKCCVAEAINKFLPYVIPHDDANIPAYYTCFIIPSQEVHGKYAAATAILQMLFSMRPPKRFGIP
eukprot:7255731-Ditylum_brightwellii.AAC.1